MDKETGEKIKRLQLLEQNVQGIYAQKQQFQSQQVEVESALKELETTETAYKIVGSIMVKSSKEQLKQELTGKQEILAMRLKAIEKQEKTMRERAEELQQQVLGALKDEKES